MTKKEFASLSEKVADGRPLSLLESERLLNFAERRWPIALRSDEMTEASEHVFNDAGAWWFATEDESSIGPFPTVDAADDAFKAYCREALGPRKSD